MSEQNRENKEKRGDFLTARQLAEVLQISESTIHKLRRKGRIPAVMVTARLIRFNLRDVRAALATQAIEPIIETVPTNNKTSAKQLAFEDLFTETFD
ncbi:MAG: helix-turn-helix domain-containing protein [Blastocatellia bacterium]|nr:helix-turn-helix domain-containing protein [Blastocatellia bacterium]MBL8196844.1 helix-turn-helix domain-containing protein [Blastocatellia bacterium]MBN8724046.1 helix-turn-helix domain-containing protein [Acidobacteriota bacterium]